MSRINLTKVATGPSLKQFVMRAEVLKQYRDVLKLTRHLDESTRTGIREFARQSIESTRHITDETHIRQLIVDGKRKVQQLETQLNMAR